ncbi:MAG TPA: GNAT family N-acetyltransferase [Nocardioides sp.]|nr:GNAT family N-acetyltransferase [Nocardioides sp.]
MSRILHPLFGRVIGAVASGWSIVDVHLREVDADDRDAVERYAAVDNAVRALSPWVHPTTPYRVEMMLRNGWDGEPGRHFLVQAAGEDVGIASVDTTEYDNLDLAWVNAAIHPEHRRRGLGTAAFDSVVEVARGMGRTKLGTDSWDDEPGRSFAAARGWDLKSTAINRRQHLGELEPGRADRLYDEALAHVGEYELERIEGRSPADLLESLAVATAAINDAPLDDLDIEDEVFTGDRVAAYENAQLASGFRLYRIIARHRGTGEIAGLTVATVDTERPAQGHQHDTSVVRAHRGHRLGLWLKADMMRWLAETEPQLETIDTWNAESNDHMIGVNERLGYRVMARGLEFQRRI